MDGVGIDAAKTTGLVVAVLGFFGVVIGVIPKLWEILFKRVTELEKLLDETRRDLYEEQHRCETELGKFRQQQQSDKIRLEAMLTYLDMTPEHQMVYKHLITKWRTEGI